MPNEIPLITRRRAVILFGALAACFVAGAFCDPTLSWHLLDQGSLFGRLLAAYGHFPAAAAVSVAGALFIRSIGPGAGFRAAGLLVLGCGLNALAFAYVASAPAATLDLPLAARGIVALLLIAGIDALAIRVLRSVPRRELLRFACFLLFVIALENLIVFTLKLIWARPRMRLIVTTPEVAFQPWWHIGSGQRTAAAALGIAPEEFRSFPSGHTAAAACALVVTALPAVRPALARWSGALFWGGVAVPALVAVSRIIMGAHFLSDVAGGFAVTFAVILLAERIFFNNRATQDATASGA